MIPPVIGDETASPGEREIFERFQSEPGTDHWAVLHSLDVPRHRRQLMGEIDFVIAVPGKGVLCLEVKSHRRVRRSPDGLWHLGQSPPTRISPFRQASEAMHSLRKYVAGRPPDLGKVLFCSAVCFTRVPFTLASPAEWHDWQVIDAGALRARPIADLVTAVLEHARALAASTPSASWFNASASDPSPGQVGSLVKVLRPSFEFFESPKSRRRQREDELLRYTAEQFAALDAMVVNPRVVFEGAAGTGKTLLAIEETRRSVLRGERALFCCFNRLLGQWLKIEAEPFGDSVVTGTFHSYLLQMTGHTVPPGVEASFWEQELPGAAIEKALSDAAPPFDILVIDEAQDLLRDDYLDVLDLLVDGGLAEGRWRMFGDFERQAIYGSSCLPIADALAERSRGAPRFILTKNCRNTPRIASFVRLLAAYERGFPEVLRPDNGIEPQMIYYDTTEDQDAKLAKLLDELFGDGYKGHEIIVLSPYAQGSAAQRMASPPWSQRLRPAAIESKGGVRYTTVHAYKGLEAPVVIVTDISSIGTDADNSLFYTAVTRATERLYVLAASQVKPAVIELLLRQGTAGRPR